MAGEVVTEVSSTNGNVKEQCGVDAIPCRDLPNGAGVECNGVKMDFDGIENGIGKEEDADGAYVFINGSCPVSENGDNDEKFSFSVPVGESLGNHGDLKSNGEIQIGEDGVNHCNGHCGFEKVGAVVREAGENGKFINHENGDFEEREENGVVAEEDMLGKLQNSSHSEVVEVMSSAGLVAFGGEEKVEEESFEMVEKVIEVQDDNLDLENSSDSKELSANSEVLPDQEDSTSGIVGEVDEPQAVSSYCKEPVENAAEMLVEVEGPGKHVEVVPESRWEASVSEEEGSAKITEQLSPPVKSAEVPGEFLLNRSNDSWGADCFCGTCPWNQSSACAVKMAVKVASALDCSCGLCLHNQSSEMAVKVKSASGANGKISKSRKQATGSEVVPESRKAASGSDEKGSTKIAEQLPLPVKSAVVSGELLPSSRSSVSWGSDCFCGTCAWNQSSVCAVNMPVKVASAFDCSCGLCLPNQSSEMAVKVKSASDANRKNTKSLKQASGSKVVPESRKAASVSEEEGLSKITEQLPVSVESPPEVSGQPLPHSQSTVSWDADCSCGTCTLNQSLVRAVKMAVKVASTFDCSCGMCLCNPSSEMAVKVKSASDVKRKTFESQPVSHLDIKATRICKKQPEVIQENTSGSSQQVCVDQNSEVVISDLIADLSSCPESCDTNTTTFEGVGGDPIAEETVVIQADAAHSKAEHVDLLLANETSASQSPTNSTGTKICFGSISHEELSSLSEARSIEVKPSAGELSPDLESPENDGSEKLTSLAPEVVTRFFNYRVRIPRYDGEDITVQLNEAQALVDEKTRIRDAINAEIQAIRGTRKSYSEEVEAAAAKERTARDSFKSKRDEIDKLQSVQNKAKSALSIDDIDSRIRSMEHRIEHETLALKEEKQLLRDIKLLKLDREQQISRMGKLDDELKEALEQKEPNEERLKVLRKELDLLRGDVSKAEAVTRSVKKKQYDGYEKIHELLDQFRAADAVRQEAFVQLKNLKKQRHEKTKYFFKYRDDARISSDLGAKGDRDGVSQFCAKQVEDFMELWNNNVEFRNDYIRCSLRGTLKRLGTKDGRSLGMDEQPPVIPPYPSERIVKTNSTTAFPSLEQARARAAPFPAVPSHESVPVKPVEQKKQNSKAKVNVKPSVAVVVALDEAVRDDEASAVAEEPKLTKEEEEKIRKEEELRKQREEARLKEERRLEEKAKAEAALLRKKRNAEKAQARAVTKAQKEAEQKEKEKEKRLKKKERKKAGGSLATVAAGEGEPAPCAQTPSESPREIETREKVETVAKRPQKPAHLMKQAKVKSTIPPPLRNRGKRKMQTWMWVIIVAAVILALFLAGNMRRLF